MARWDTKALEVGSYLQWYSYSCIYLIELVDWRWYMLVLSVWIFSINVYMIWYMTRKWYPNFYFHSLVLILEH